MKKRIVGLILVGVLVLGLTGCKDDSVHPIVIKTGIGYDVVAMGDTGVLYYATGYKLAPYYSKNGKLCRWENGEIVEIDGEIEK